MQVHVETLAHRGYSHQVEGCAEKRLRLRLLKVFFADASKPNRNRKRRRIAVPDKEGFKPVACIAGKRAIGLIPRPV